MGFGLLGPWFVDSRVAGIHRWYCLSCILFVVSRALTYCRELGHFRYVIQKSSARWSFFPMHFGYSYAGRATPTEQLPCLPCQFLRYSSCYLSTIASLLWVERRNIESWRSVLFDEIQGKRWMRWFGLECVDRFCGWVLWTIVSRGWVRSISQCYPGWLRWYIEALFHYKSFQPLTLLIFRH